MVPKHLLDKQDALKGYNDSILQQRNEMGQALEAKAGEVEAERKAREALAQQLTVLQSKVMGRSFRLKGLDPEVRFFFCTFFTFSSFLALCTLSVVHPLRTSSLLCRRTRKPSWPSSKPSSAAPR